MAGASWSFDAAHQHLKRFCGIEVSDEFIRQVALSSGKKLAEWMGESPTAAEAFRAGEQFPGSPQVLDIFHALEYVCRGAKSIFGEGTPEAEKYSDRGRTLLLSDGYAGVTTWVGEMLGADPKGGDGAGLGGVLNYLAGHRDRLNYAVRLKRGQSIGTGMVEGAAKNLIGRRLKANNAQWRVENVGKMAGLCCAIYSDCWDKFWERT